jgi:hypothetical protein
MPADDYLHNAAMEASNHARVPGIVVVHEILNPNWRPPEPIVYEIAGWAEAMLDGPLRGANCEPGEGAV